MTLMEKELSSYLPPMTREDHNYFLQVLDPFNTQKITFSECVQLFSSHLVPHSDLQGDVIDGTPLKHGRLPDHERAEGFDQSEDGGAPITMIPLLEKVNKMLVQ